MDCFLTELLGGLLAGCSFILNKQIWEWYHCSHSTLSKMNKHISQMSKYSFEMLPGKQSFILIALHLPSALLVSQSSISLFIYFFKQSQSNRSSRFVFQVRNSKASGYCLDQGSEDDDKAILYPCHGMSSQVWAKSWAVCVFMFRKCHTNTNTCSNSNSCGFSSSWHKFLFKPPTSEITFYSVIVGFLGNSTREKNDCLTASHGAELQTPTHITAKDFKW